GDRSSGMPVGARRSHILSPMTVDGPQPRAPQPLGLGVWMPGGHPRPGTPPPDRAFLALAVTESCGTQSCDNRRDDLRRRFPATPGAHSGTFPCLRLGRISCLVSSVASA